MKLPLSILISALLLSGCGIVDSKPDCSLVQCANNPVAIKVKYVDKATGNSLFGTGKTAFTTNDLKGVKAQSSAYKTEFTVDNVDNSIINIKYLTSVDFITLGNFASDKVTVSLIASDKSCCPQYEIAALKINDETICAPCKDLDTRIITIAK